MLSESTEHLSLTIPAVSAKCNDFVCLLYFLAFLNYSLSTVPLVFFFIFKIRYSLSKYFIIFIKILNL